MKKIIILAILTCCPTFATSVVMAQNPARDVCYNECNRQYAILQNRCGGPNTAFYNECLRKAQDWGASCYRACSNLPR